MRVLISLAFAAGDTLRVLTAAPGRYAIVGFGFAKATCRARRRDTIVLAPGLVTYVGDWTIGLRPLLDDKAECESAMRDRWIEARLEVRKLYPQLTSQRKFVSSLFRSTLDRRVDDRLENDSSQPERMTAIAIMDNVIHGTQRFRDQMCACDGAACRDRVSNDYAVWQREFGLDDTSPAPTSDEQAKIDDAQRGLDACKAAP